MVGRVGRLVVFGCMCGWMCRYVGGVRFDEWMYGLMCR